MKEAYPILIDIMCLPDALAYALFGDSILEAGSRMIASVCGFDLIIIKCCRKRGCNIYAEEMY